MGYKSRIVDAVINCKAVYITDEDNIYNAQTEYNPITNANQSRDIEEKLLILGWEVHFMVCKYLLKKFDDSTNITAVTLPLVIYKAALYEANK